MAILNFRSAKPTLRDSTRLRDSALTALFAALLVFNVARTLHHAMWRDEMQVFLLAADSPSLSALFRNLAHEPHPDLWPVLVWLGTRIYADPISMQIIHALLATCVWLLIWRAAPFPAIEKILLLLSYFLFWEYFAVSRNYVLVALAGFAIVTVRTLWPRRVLLSFVLAGALANTMVLGTIWSLVVAARLVLERTAPWTVRVAGVAFYLACLAVALVSLIPAPGTVPYGSHLGFDPGNLGSLAVIPAGAFFPVDSQWLAQAVRFVLQPSGDLPHFWNPNPLLPILQVVQGHSARALLIVGLLVSPPLLCWFLVRDWKFAAEFALIYLGIVLFAALWNFTGSSRHHGIVFLAFAGAVWMTSARAPLTGWRVAGWRSLLAISALGGLLTLTSEARVFSHGRAVAEWLTRNGLADAFIMGSRDTTLSTISGYLGRPLYYLECECLGRFIVWNAKRTQFIDAAEIVRRANRTQPGSASDVILITNIEIPAEVARDNAPDRTLTLLQSFTGAEVESENYFVFRATPRSDAKF
jgi:hypothetical protein